MAASRSMAQVYLASTVILAAASAIVIGYLAITQQYRRFETQLQEYEQSYIKTRRSFLKTEIDWALDYTEFMRASVDQRLRRRLEDRVAQAYELVESAYRNNGYRQPQDFVNTIREIFRPIRFAAGDGFYFFLKGNGEVILLSGVPELEGQQLMNYRDPGGRETVREMIDLAKSDGHGFVETLTQDARGSGVIQKRLCYVKYFAPLDLVMGTGEFRGFTEQLVKQDVLSRFTNRDYSNEQVTLMVFDEKSAPLFQNDRIDQWLKELSGAGFLSPSQPKNAVTMSSNPSGFLEYKSQPGNFRVLNYWRRYPEWGWVVGARASLADIDRRLVAEREKLRKQLSIDVAMIIAIIFIGTILAAIFARRMAMATAAGFERFSLFFERASRGGEYISYDHLPYREFIKLAKNANQMVDDRERFQKALVESEKRLQLALDLSSSFMWEVDLRSRAVTFGKGFVTYLGYPEHEGKVVSNDKMIGFVHPGDQALLYSVMNIDAQVLVTGIEFRVKCGDGHYCWLQARGGLTRLAGPGHTSKALGTVVDISAQKKMEQELVVARIAAEEASIAKSQFLSGMSHELRTPLNGVLGNVQILLRSPSLSNDQLIALESIERCGENLLRMIDDILHLANIDSGQIEFVAEECRVQELLQITADGAKRKLRANGLRLDVRCDAAVPAVIRSDGKRVSQILLGLVESAIRHTPQGSVCIDVNVDQPGRMITFSVVDDGVPLNERSELKFLLAESSLSSVTDASGIGLVICQRIARVLGGSILAEALEGGCCVSLRLPLAMQDFLIKAQAPQTIVFDEDTGSVCWPSEQLDEIRSAVTLGDLDAVQCWVTERKKLADEAQLAWLHHLQVLIDYFDLDGLQDALENTSEIHS